MSKLETNQVDPATGTTLTLGTSGDTITIPSGVTIANSGTATGFGGDNTPAFFVHNSSNQSITDATATKVTLDSEDYDTDNAFASNKFTVPSGEAGKYLFYFAVDGNTGADSNYDRAFLYIYKNNSQISEFANDLRNNPGRRINVNGSLSLDLSAGDYIELYIYIDDGSGNPTITGDSGITTYLGGHKLIGV
jgi:hypothetical protein